MKWFKKPVKRPRYTVVRKKKEIPEGLWTKCPQCNEIIYNKQLEENYKICPKCRYHFRLSIQERIKQLFEAESFVEMDQNLVSINPLQFPFYEEKLEREKKKTNLLEACVTGKAKIGKHSILAGLTDSRFLMGSMASVVGEKITRLIEKAGEMKKPLLIISGSGGGARMYEGILSLMQMAKTSAALANFQSAGGLYISVVTDPTMAGVWASFASLGDIIIAEPGALIGFTGPRVIEQTIHQKLPKGFQSSEFQIEHGMVDLVVERNLLKETIVKILDHLVKV
jgi:acetyl-CoA carboxylase carboxyl transferase subunit beta